MLLLAQRDPLRDPVAMSFVNGVTMGLFTIVKHSQGHDGQPVDGRSRCFGIDRRVRMKLPRGSSLCDRLENGGEFVIDLLDRVVPSLIELVNRSFDVCNLRIGRRGVAGFVFLVPQPEIELVVHAHEALEPVERVFDRFLVPPNDGIVLK